MTMNNCMTKFNNMQKDLKKDVRKKIDFLNGLTLNNNSDVDLSINSKHREKPLFNFKCNCKKELRIMPILIAVLGILLICIMASDCYSKND